jgi:hypothetical protein
VTRGGAPFIRYRPQFCKFRKGFDPHEDIFLSVDNLIDALDIDRYLQAYMVQYVVAKVISERQISVLQQPGQNFVNGRYQQRLFITTIKNSMST